MNTPVRVAMVGAGHWHALYDACYLKHLSSFDDVQVVGIQDSDPTVAQARADELGLTAAYDDIDELISHSSPDFVVALGRHDEMAATARTLIMRSIPFLMEKPLGTSAAEVEKVAHLAHAQRAWIAVPLAQRYAPAAQLARTMFEEGEFGEVSNFTFRFVKGRPARYISWGSAWMLDPGAAGGGCLRNFGVHGFDLARHLVGLDLTIVGASVSNAVHHLGIEDHAVAVAAGAADEVAIVEVGYTLPSDGRDSELRIGGAKVQLAARGNEIEIVTPRGVEHRSAAAVEPLHRQVLRESLEAWRSQTSPPIGIDDCLHAVRLVDASYAAAGRENS